MSETILKILLSELQILRIVCKCKAVVEMSITAFERTGDQPDMKCPGCGTTIRVGRADKNHGPIADALDDLAKAWKGLEAMNRAENFKVQFVLPVKEPEQG